MGLSLARSTKAALENRHMQMQAIAIAMPTTGVERLPASERMIHDKGGACFLGCLLNLFGCFQK